MPQPTLPSSKDVSRDLIAGVVVFLVALPLCLGIALASNAPLFSGLLSGIIGGLVVGTLSGSQTSVAGPAAGLTAVVIAQLEVLGSFDAFLVAVVLAGVIQIAMGVLRAGFISSFFPSSVIKGLLAAIGVILILKQIPHLVGHDPDAMGEMAFHQPDGENTLSELLRIAASFHVGAALVGFLSLLLLIAWNRTALLKRSPVPAPLAAVVFGVCINWLFELMGSALTIRSDHLVRVPVANNAHEALDLLRFPDWSQLANPAIYTAAVTVALVASLETLLNLQAVDNIDPEQRHSPPNRELWAQGVGNMLAGLLGGLPVTSVIVRSSVNINSGNKTRFSTIFHGILLVSSVLLMPTLINRIPLSCLAAILLVTGVKLANPGLVKQMHAEGRSQLLPFIITIVAIVTTDLLLGILIGLGVSITFILASNFRRPLRQVLERHAAGDVLRIELANQVSFFNRAGLHKVLHQAKPGEHILIDARNTDFIDRDILDLIDDFQSKTAPAHGVTLSLLGLETHYAPLKDRIRFVHHSVPALQSKLDPVRVIDVLKEGNQRFRSGDKLTRDVRQQVLATARRQSPLAVVFSCADSRTPAELVFDVSIGDILSVRIAGNVVVDKVLGSIEYGCFVAGARVIVVLGHTSCQAVEAAVGLAHGDRDANDVVGCEHLAGLIQEIRPGTEALAELPKAGTPAWDSFIDGVTRRNVLRMMDEIRRRSAPVRDKLEDGSLLMVGGLYDVRTGMVDFFDEQGEFFEVAEPSASDGNSAEGRPDQAEILRHAATTTQSP